MVSIDYTTLALVLAIQYIAVTLVFLVLLKVNKSEKGIGVWLISSIISIAGFVGLFFRDVFVPYGQITGTFALLTSTYLIFEGVLRFREIGKKENRRHLNVALFVAFFIISVITAKTATLRYLILDALILGMCPLIIVYFIKGTKNTERRLSYLFAGAFIFEGIWFAIRWFLAISDAFGGRPIMEHPFMGTIYFVSVIWILLYIFSIMLIINYRAQDRLKNSAEKDALTGLCNRRKLDVNFKSLVDANISRKEEFAVFLLDINGFKAVNDIYGHVFGDMLLIKLAEKIKTVTRTEDFACRFGGDEFILVLNVNGKEDGAIKARDRIKTIIEEPFVHENFKISIKIAIGYAVIDNIDITLDKILASADKNMYQEKEKHYETTEVTNIN